MAPAKRKPKAPKKRTRRVAEPDNPEPKKRKTPGGVSLYTTELAEEICRRLSDGESLRRICRSDGMPTWQTVLNWVRARKDFAVKYREARELQCEVWADEIVDISDDGTNDYVETKHGPKFNRESFERSRLRVDSRKWLLSKRLRGVYGDKTEHALTTPNGAIAIKLEERNALIDSICALVIPKADGKTKPDNKKAEPRER